ncbi:hypothetical protein GDO86_011274, partial [Hymenochirus boettgeri]
MSAEKEKNKEKKRSTVPDHTGRSSLPPNISNADEDEVPSLELFGIVPRGVNMKDYLEVQNVHLFKKVNEINKREHHTNRYYNNNLIIRRGQTFNIQIDFNRPYNPEKDRFWVEYVI